MTGEPSGSPDEVAARLSADVRASALPVITQAERLALTRYQGLDRFYELVNGVLRGELRFSELEEVSKERVAAAVRGLGTLLGRWSLPEPVRVYRGVRDLTRTFGTMPQPGTRHVLTGFVSSSLHRSVALDQFTGPRLGVAAVLVLDVAPGTPAIWLPPLGDPSLADQAELLLGPSTTVVVNATDDRSGTLEVTCEVIE